MIELLLLIFKELKKRFSKPSLPHPEEAQNLSATLENTDIDSVSQKWLDDWHVPISSWVFWGGIEVKLVPGLQIIYRGQLVKVPAATWAQERRMEIDPQWATPGVVAHEMCHIAQTFLPDMNPFMEAYNTSRDPMLKLVRDKMQGKDPAWANSPSEIQADCYRYLGEKIPESMKEFYPFLF